MPSVVFDCEIDQETLNSLKDLRIMRRQVLVQQMTDIETTLGQLLEMGAIETNEVGPYREKIVAEIKAKLHLLEARLEDPETIYSEEIEMYLDLLSSP